MSAVEDVSRITNTKKVKNTNGWRELVLDNPLVAVACMTRNEMEKDEAARHADYTNSLLAFNNKLGLHSVFQVLDEDASKDVAMSNSIANENDEKKEKDAGPNLKYRLEHVTKKLDEDTIRNAKYKVKWQFDNPQAEKDKNELISFCKRVVKLLEDKKSKYDGLIFVLTGFAKINQTRDDAGFDLIADSSGNAFVKLTDIYQLFDKDHCKLDWKTFPIVFMVDRYCEMTPSQMQMNFDSIVKSNPELTGTVPQSKVVKFFNLKMNSTAFEAVNFMDEKIHLKQFYAHNRSYAICARKKGGMVTRAIYNVFTKRPVDETYSKFRTLFGKCHTFIRENGFGQFSVQYHPLANRHDQLEVRLSLSFWDSM